MPHCRPRCRVTIRHPLQVTLPSDNTPPTAVLLAETRMAGSKEKCTCLMGIQATSSFAQDTRKVTCLHALSLKVLWRVQN